MRKDITHGINSSIIYKHLPVVVHCQGRKYRFELHPTSHRLVISYVDGRLLRCSDRYVHVHGAYPLKH